MTTPKDPGPIAPRRPLGKPPAGADVAAPASDEAGAPVQTVVPDTSRAASNGTRPSRSSGAGASSGTRPAPAPPVAGPAASSAPVAPPLYYPDSARPGTDAAQPLQPRTWSNPAGVDVDTQQSLPVPPAPVVPPPPVDKRAERAAARAQRKLQASRPRTIRRAKLRVIRVDPWSVTKAAFLLSIAFGIMCVVAVFLVFSIMSASGLWDSVNTTIQGVVNQKPSQAFDIRDYVGMSRVMGITMLISAIDVVIMTALATLGAFIYNMSASLLGGVEITLAEDLH